MLSVVIPLFNEETNVPILQRELVEALAGLDYEIVFVDDGSRDATRERIDRSLGSDDGKSRVRVLAFTKNTGQSAAMYAGLQAARGSVVALLDGDLQNDPADIPKLLDTLEKSGADLVCGYRARRKDTLVKRLTSRIANSTTSACRGK